MKPDFSGSWTLNREASTLSPAAAAFLGASWLIDHRDPVFRHRASFVTGADPIQYEYELRADGRDVASVQGEATTLSTCAWDGDALVVRFDTTRPDSRMTVSFRYELFDMGRRLRATEELRGTDHDQDNVWVFDRQ